MNFSLIEVVKNAREVTIGIVFHGPVKDAISKNVKIVKLKFMDQK